MQKTKKSRHSPGKSNRVRRGKAKSLSAQQTIPYLVMHPDGVFLIVTNLHILVSDVVFKKNIGGLLI